MAERRSFLDEPDDRLRVRRALDTAGEGPVLAPRDAERLAERSMARLRSRTDAAALQSPADEWARALLAVGRPLLPSLVAATLLLTVGGAWTLVAWSSGWPLSMAALGEIAQLTDAVTP